VAIPRTILVPAIFFFSFIGVYLVTFNTFDIHMMILIAVGALIMRLFGYPMAPLLLGFILGGLMEDNLRRSLTIYDGSMRFLWERSLTLAIMILTILIVLAPFIGPAIKGIFRKRSSRSNQSHIS